jgi:two-component system, NtrC family, response regulator GlrR
MNETQILVVDFNLSEDLGTQLISMLQSNSRFEIKTLQATDYRLDSLKDCIPAIAARNSPGLIFLVLASNTLERAAEMVDSIETYFPQVPIIVVTQTAEAAEMINLLKKGVADFITPPIREIDILPRIWRLLAQNMPEPRIKQKMKEKLAHKQIIGESPAFLNEIEKIPLVAKCDASVLITGETGTGKELIARAIHYLSMRANKPFISVNCGALPIDLVENELFGHERGAYTGAATTQAGIIQEADGGTLFLDEVDTLPPLAQVKLLRFLQEKEYRPLGSAKTLRADVRIVAASNSRLQEAIKQGKLRQDLYYRLNVVPISLPALRERREDIPLLTQHFLKSYSARFGKIGMSITFDAMQELLFQEWPGNIRELEHVIERAVILCEQDAIEVKHIIIESRSKRVAQKSFQQMKAEIISEFERNYLCRMLEVYQGNITQAAHAARKNRRAFWGLINKHQINVQIFKARY